MRSPPGLPEGGGGAAACAGTGVRGPQAGDSGALAGAAADPHGWEKGTGGCRGRQVATQPSRVQQDQHLFWGVIPLTQRSDGDQSGKGHACANPCSLRKKRKISVSLSITQEGKKLPFLSLLAPLQLSPPGRHLRPRPSHRAGSVSLWKSRGSAQLGYFLRAGGRPGLARPAGSPREARNPDPGDLPPTFKL